MEGSTYHVGKIDEAEEIEKGDSGNDAQIDLPSKPAMAFAIKY